MLQCGKIPKNNIQVEKQKREEKNTKMPSKANQTSLAEDNVWEAPFLEK